MNFFEQLALGIEKGVYDEEIVSHLVHPIAQYHIDQYQLLKLADARPDDYSSIRALCEKWKREKATSATEARQGR